MNENEIKKTVRKEYGKVAAQADSGCGCGCGCGPAPDSARIVSAGIGYTDDQMDAVPEDSNLGLGCGNPTALGALELGQTVLDLGSGAGFDCFLAARKVGPEGQVIGVDMT
ncbi:MAG: methyltransferase domain-containing protein, partial [Methanopyri archaeon]|nr:methyltransferase domain-containing protein [Methanopyri archaeon]